MKKGVKIERDKTWKVYRLRMEIKWWKRKRERDTEREREREMRVVDVFK